MLDTRKDLETRIAQRLEALSPDDMQRLAEDYARLSFPLRFPHFDFRALSREGKTRGGWPDAYVVIDGRVDGVEATTHKTKPAVLAHLKDDLAEAKSRKPRLSGFIFVSGHPSIQLEDTELLDWQGQFAKEAGMDLDRVDLVFGQRLIHALARPEFARARWEVLQLDDLPDWFRPVCSDLAPSNPQAEFIPSPEEYESGWVHRPLVADEIVDILETDGRALVRGVGASGKTVLAWLLALETTRRVWPAYYLDLATLGERQPEASNGLERDLVRLGHPRALFVLDNIHLDEQLAKGLASQWERMPLDQRPRLLLVGRELRTTRGSPIEGLKIRTVPLKARQAEVRGVYRRLIWRKTGSTTIEEPPPHVLDDWVKTFGADPTSADTTTDLIAFSAAVLKRLRDLVSCNWNLTEDDAVEEIREHYLDKLDDGEVRNLMRLSVLAKWELALSDKALANLQAGFRLSMREMGLVFREQQGAKEQYTNYRLAHAALGRLFLAAAYDPVDRASELRVVACVHPATGIALARALVSADEPDEARSILSLLMQDPRRLLELPHANASLHALRLVHKLGAAQLADTGRVWADLGNRVQLLSHALATPLHYLRDFLVYTEDEANGLRLVFDTLVAELGLDQNRGRLVERALLTPLDLVQSFLAYAEKTGALKAAFENLCAGLGSEPNRARLVERALLTPLGLVRSFLAYAEERSFRLSSGSETAKKGALKAAFENLCAGLGSEPNRARLVERAFLTPLDHVQTFLAYAENKPALKAAYDNLSADLGSELNRERLIERALDLRLEHLQSFLKYAAKPDAFHAIFHALTTGLKTDQHRSRLVKRFVLAPLDALVSILSADTAHDLWDAVIADVDEKIWEQHRLQDIAPKLDAFASFQRLVGEIGRPELASAPALSIVRMADPERWKPPQGGIHHLSHVLRCADQASQKEVRHFLHQVASAEWIDYQVKFGASVGGLAGSLLAVSNSLAPELRTPFLRPSLSQRVIDEFGSYHNDAAGWAAALSLLGAASALGVRFDFQASHWPGDTDLLAVLELRAPNSEQAMIGPLQIQLWLGLREMVRLRRDSVSVPSQHGEEVLALWRAALAGEIGQSKADYLHQVSGAMIAWLDRCRASGWRLVSDDHG